MVEALEELDIGTHHTVSEHRALLAERLARISPGDVNRVIFGVSGGEAVDAAIKLARGHTGRAGIISAIGRLPRAYRLRPAGGQRVLLRALRAPGARLHPRAPSAI